MQFHFPLLWNNPRAITAMGEGDWEPRRHHHYAMCERIGSMRKEQHRLVCLTDWHKQQQQQNRTWQVATVHEHSYDNLATRLPFSPPVPKTVTCIRTAWRIRKARKFSFRCCPQARLEVALTLPNSISLLTSGWYFFRGANQQSLAGISHNAAKGNEQTWRRTAKRETHTHKRPHGPAIRRKLACGLGNRAQ